MRSIQAKIMVCMTVTLLTALVIIGFASVCLNYSSTVSTLEQSLTETADLAADRVAQELIAYKNICREIGCISAFSNDNIPEAEKLSIIQARINTYGFADGDLFGADGVGLMNPVDCSDRAWFQAAMRGEVYMSEPVTNKVTGASSVIFAAPVWKGGISGGTVVGVVMFSPQETFLSEIMSTISVGDNSSAYMINSSGTVVAHINIVNVQKSINTTELAKSTPALEGIAAIEKKMMAGGSGCETYTYGGSTYFLAYNQVDGTDGWSIAVTSPLKSFLGATYTGIKITIAIVVVADLIAAFIAWRLASGIGNHIKACAQRLSALAEGDLTTPVPEFNTKDETMVLLGSTSKLKNDLSSVIGDMDYLLDHMSNGDFTIASHCRDAYVGEFKSLLDSEYNLKVRLIDILRRIDAAADQVSSGAEQVSIAAQALAQGSTEQASSVEELAASINEISDSINATAGHAKTAEDENKRSHSQIEACNGQMKDLVAAIQVINEKSGEIDKVIKTIEDIAFQTNILALNAAVEAARAGAAGKGFAVVADEVRNLASKSQQAAQSTTVLIQETVDAVEKGTALSGETEGSLRLVVESAEAVLKAVSQISTATGEQANSASQVSVGVDQIASVVQTNSATSEESAAASEELSGQARMLKEMVSSFKLPKENV